MSDDLDALEAAARALLHDEAHGHMCPSCDEYGIPSLMVEQAEGLVALIARVRRAEAALDWLERNPQCELSHDGWDDPPKWRVHEVTGGRNDRVWTLVGEGDTAREAIEAARAVLEGRSDG